MGISAGTDLALNITEISDLISTVVNFIGLLFYAWGPYAGPLVGLMMLSILIKIVWPIIEKVTSMDSIIK